MAQCSKCARFDHCGMVWKRLGEEAEDVTCVGFDPVRTNADRIRAMTDEELAQMFWEKASCELCKLKKQYCSDDCKGTWLEWLRQEISE